MKPYESPKMRFEELTLFEKIAEVCWGSKTVTFTFNYPYDDDHNDPSTPDTIPGSYSLASGCGNETDPVLNWIKGNLTAAEYDYWINHTDNKSSNLANTKFTGVSVTTS
ncbi:MAG: hypothetical protein K0S18_2239 [Anaerocolumna sp.]|jgi:hypothetical protein|nr:hypothetical protein [Anaerocolumna sp.]